MKPTLLFLSMAVALWAQPLASPRVGFILDGRGGLDPVLGLAGSFVVARASITQVVSASYSGSFGLVKTQSALIVTDQTGRTIASEKAPAGPALFGFSADGSPALVYLAETSTLRAWNGRRFAAAALDSAVLRGKAVLSVSEAAVIVERADGLWQLRIGSSGSVVSQLALQGVTAPVLLVDGGLVYRDGRGLVVRRADGSEKHVNARSPERVSFQQMGDGWVEVTDLDSGKLFALNIEPGRERFYQLPEVRQ